MRTYPPLQGQEAAQVASTHALADEDWLSFQYREHGAVVACGLFHEYLLYWLGHEAHPDDVFSHTYDEPTPHSRGTRATPIIQGASR